MRRKAVILFLCSAVAVYMSVVFAGSESEGRKSEIEDEVRSPDQIEVIRDGEIVEDAVLELFINASEWDDEHQDVRYESEEKLVELGARILPVILEKYLSSRDLRRRITLDSIVSEIGSPAADSLLEYLNSEDITARRHAVYLLGECTFVETMENDALLGPLQEDLKIRDALLKTLNSENDHKVIRSLLNSLARIRDPDLIEVIAGYLNHEDQTLRLSAAVALKYIPHIDTVKRLLNALDDPLGTVRQAAAVSLSADAVADAGFDLIIDLENGREINSAANAFRFEILTDYLKKNSDKDSENLRCQKNKICRKAESVLHPNSNAGWRLKAYAARAAAFCENRQNALNMLQGLLKKESHPFLTGAVRQTLEYLEQEN